MSRLYKKLLELLRRFQSSATQEENLAETYDFSRGNPFQSDAKDKRLTRLRAMLREDTGSDEEACALLETVARLDAWEAPVPMPSAQTELLKTLKPGLPRRPSYGERLASWLPLLILRAQLRVVRGEIWTGSALVMALGALVTLASQDVMPLEHGLPLALVMPVVAAGGVAFLYGPEVDPALEIQLATPTSPRVALLARMALLFGFDLSFGLAASAALAAFNANVSLWPLVTAWLAPMAFLSALAFLLSVLLKDALTGMIISVGLWSVQVTARLLEGSMLSFAIPNLTTPGARPLLWLSAALLGALAFWLAGREEQWIRG